MTHSSPENSNDQKIEQKRINIKGSRLNDTQIGQTSSGEIHQAARDIVNNAITLTLFSSGEESWSQEKLDKVGKLKESLEKEFSKRLVSVASLVSELRIHVEQQLSTKSQKDKDTILNLINELQSLVGHENAVILIKEEIDLYKQASSWLSNNISILSHEVTNRIFSRNEFPRLRRRQKFLSSDKVKEGFNRDIQLYLTWVATYMDSGATPPDKVDGKIFDIQLDFATETYKDAFSIMTHDIIHPQVSGLNLDVAEIIASYINRFLIDRELERDIK